MAITIIGVNLENRIESAIEFQKNITKFGCDIRTRIGLHSCPEELCSNKGIILLEVIGDGAELAAELKKHWEIQTMHFE